MRGKKSRFDYFGAFQQQADIAYEEASLLVKIVDSFTSAEAMRDQLNQAHDIENSGDLVNQSILRNVAVDFVTPIERDDIIELASCMDNVIDSIESVIQSFYMYDVHKMHELAPSMVRCIQSALKALQAAMAEFPNFKNSTRFHQLIVDVNDCEEQADKIYMNGIRRLYTADTEDALRVEVWSRIFDLMESTCDTCEHAADIMGNIMLKNI